MARGKQLLAVLNRSVALVVMAFLLMPACIEKPDPLPPDEPDEPEVPVDPVEPEKPKDKEVTLMGEFSEEFSAKESEYSRAVQSCLLYFSLRIMRGQSRFRNPF